MSNLTNRYFEKDITHFRNISDKYQMLWLAPARTATRSVCQVLQHYDFKVHTDMIFMKKQEIICPFTPQGDYTHDFDILPQDDKYKIICSVRNPYSRFVGLLRYHNIFRNDLWETKGDDVDGRPHQEHEFKEHKGGIIETLNNEEVKNYKILGTATGTFEVCLFMANKHVPNFMDRVIGFQIEEGGTAEMFNNAMVEAGLIKEKSINVTFYE